MAIKTENEKTRNDKYLIMKKNEKNKDLISYGKNLIKKINNEKLFPNEVSEDCLKDDTKFRKLITALDEKGYYVFQLTRL